MLRRCYFPIKMYNLIHWKLYVEFGFHPTIPYFLRGKEQSPYIFCVLWHHLKGLSITCIIWLCSYIAFKFLKGRVRRTPVGEWNRIWNRRLSSSGRGVPLTACLLCVIQYDSVLLALKVACSWNRWMPRLVWLACRPLWGPVAYAIKATYHLSQMLQTFTGANWKVLLVTLLVLVQQTSLSCQNEGDFLFPVLVLLLSLK